MSKLFEKIPMEWITSRIFQHEYDHLEGILFIDKLSPLRPELIRGKLNKIKKRSKDHGKSLR
jgi:peptide deformylase